MAPVTYDQANLLLQLFDLRREPRLRQAREWFFTHCHAGSVEEMARKYPPGSVENTNIRMVTSYWEMAAGMVNRGLIDDEFFFESNGEIWIVWDRVKDLVPAIRAKYKNPQAYAHIEALCNRFDEWREKRAPGSTEVMRQILLQAAQQSAKAASE